MSTGQALARYVTLSRVGAPETLAGAAASLPDWAASQGLAFDVSASPEGERWAAGWRCTSPTRGTSRT